jgi:hypothetical protein
VVSVNVVDFETPAIVPVTVTVELPMKVEALYAEVRVSVAFPTVEVVTEAGDRLAVTPAGRPLTESATVLLRPYHADIATV